MGDGVGAFKMSSQRSNAASFDQHRPKESAARSVGGNQLLATLPASELDALRPHLDKVYLPRGTCLYEFGDSLSHAYFPTRGIVSLGYTSANGDSAELAVVGPEGVIGVEAFLGSDKAEHRAVVQTMLVAYRMRIKARSSFAEGSALQEALLKYALGLLLHISQTSICNLHHSLEQRLCRSLLHGIDRMESKTLPITQDVLAGLVGARRQGISEAVNRLRDRRLITCERGSITVLDRAAILTRACECYAVMQRHIERLLGSV